MARWAFYAGYDDDDSLELNDSAFRDDLLDVMAADIMRGTAHRSPDDVRVFIPRPDPVVLFTHVGVTAARTFDTSMPGTTRLVGLPRETPPRSRLVRRATDAYAPASFSREWDGVFRANRDNIR